MEQVAQHGLQDLGGMGFSQVPMLIAGIVVAAVGGGFVISRAARG